MRPGTKWKRRTRAERRALSERRRLAIFRMIRRDTRVVVIDNATACRIANHFRALYAAKGVVFADQ